jgi:hypothetical protein
LPSELTEPLGWVGLTWPEADEELLFEAGQKWMAYGQELTRVAEQADSVAVGAWQASEGQAAEAFEQWWTREDGPRRRLAEDAAAALLIGGALIAFAALTLSLKINFIVQLIVLAVEVAQAIATAFVTFGATTAEIPGFIAVTRVILRQFVRQVVEHLTTVIRDIFRRAENLLKKVEGAAARRVEARALARTERSLAKDLAKANPQYGTPPVPAYTLNCTHCVQAMELRRRGVDVEATALPQHYWPFGGRPPSDIEVPWGRTFTVGDQSAIESVFSQAGPGARGVVLIRWPGGGGHVFSVENVGGRVRFVDGQNGAADVAHYFLNGHSTEYLRLDDLPVPPGTNPTFVQQSLGGP